MAFPARKPEAGKAKNSWPCSTSDLLIILTIRNVFFYRINTKSSLGK